MNKVFYVVTRCGRRTEDKNYENAADAAHRADILRNILKKWDPPQSQKVEVVKTNKPHQIR